jgi:hypothetical protein
MADLNVNSIGDASGGNTATINGYTPTESNMAGRNRIINGDMRIDQRNAGAAVTASDSHPVDRFRISIATDGSFSAQQDASAPDGFVNSLKFTTTTADGTLGATQYATVIQNIEGLNVTDLGWGTASAKTVTLSFWVRCSLTGTFGGVVKNSASNRSYPFTYSISVADTWEYKTVTIAGDTSGTWLTTNGIGIRLSFGLGVGSTYSGTAGSWAGASYISATGAVSVIGTSGATFYITGVQLEAGSVATPFQRRFYGTELALCQRYYEKSYDYVQVPGSTVDNTIGGYGIAGNTTLIPTQIYYKVVKRVVGNTFTLYAYDGTSGRVSQYNTPGNTGATGCAAVKIGETGVNGIIKTGGTDFIAGNYYWWNWTSSAEL